MDSKSSAQYSSPEGGQSPEHSDNDTSTLSRSKVRAVERGSQACNECRRHKIRCHPAADDPEHIQPCARCARMSLDCVFKKHNRGRKRKHPIADDSPMSIAPVSVKRTEIDVTSRTLPTPTTPTYWKRQSPDRSLFALSVSRYPFMALDPPAVDHHPHSSGPSRQPPPPPSMSLRSMVHPESWDDVDDADDNEQYDSVDGFGERARGNRNHETSSGVNVTTPHSAMGGQSLAGDPVSAGFIAEDEAKILFDMFMRHFNVAMPILDPILHTHDWVRQQSSFLYTVILCVTSRYLNKLSGQTNIPPESVDSVHQQIVVLARDHLTWAFADAVSTVHVIQAITVLSLWKEPDDDKAAFYFNRAVILARELGLGRIPSAREMEKMSSTEKRDLRACQRLWLSLFSTNSIFHMQFRQPMLIPHTDHLVATVSHWLKHASPDHLLMDTFVAFSVDLRRRYLHYRELLHSPESEGHNLPGALSLSVLTKSMNDEWDVSSEAWIRDIIDAGGTPTYVNKPRVWYSSLRLNLNLMIVNQTLRIPPAERLPPPPPTTAAVGGTAVQMPSIPAFHHCLNAATSVLMRFQCLDKEQLTYASDTLLHFSLYAATFLWSLCRTPELYHFDNNEVDHCRDLILKVAVTLEAASAYPSSSPALHAKYLRRLCRATPPQHRSYASGTGQAPLIPQPPMNGSLVQPIDSMPMVPPASGFATDGTWVQPQTMSANSDLDFLLGDFPWTGLELPWNQLDSNLFTVPVTVQSGLPNQSYMNNGNSLV